MKYLLFIFLLLHLFSNVQAQDIEVDAELSPVHSTRNIVYGNVEYYLIGGAATISYERYLTAGEKFDFSLRGTYGRWVIGLFDVEYGDLFKVTGNFLFFKGSNHLEVDLGANLLMNDNNGGIENIIPDLFCGYTFKKPDGHFVFKAGIGFVGFVSIGAGYAF